ncbi:Zinc finger protein 622/Rei1/Reh1 like protein [Aduncisulcus paluster]|uniref:Zinc finger protein 622/Rei1/Reh1 like protein n=1 Tax=Aduncisulcus paluster TaxID=2918883 RepID=A0ABQ5K6Z2_9EUKA|nr:Zinc finger protein 622/Rei1/Reh1 like protein [Aduncisulcus paluster]
MSEELDSYTCIACRLQFRSWEEQKLHYHSELHTINLQRHLKKLPALSSSEFEAMPKENLLKDEEDVVESYSRTRHKGKRKEKVDKQKITCKCCSKSFSNEKSYEQHCRSAKHRAKARKEIESKVHQLEITQDQKLLPDIKQLIIKEEELEEEEALRREKWEKSFRDRKPIPPQCCMFCNRMIKSEDPRDLLHHLRTEHSFTLPESKYISDLEGLLSYVGNQIYLGCQCLWCGNVYHTKHAVQDHMKMKGHCMLAFDGHEREYDQFYDFAPAYPEDYDGFVYVYEGEEGEVTIKYPRPRDVVTKRIKDETGVVLMDSGSILIPKHMVKAYRLAQLKPMDFSKSRSLVRASEVPELRERDIMLVKERKKEFIEMKRMKEIEERRYDKKSHKLSRAFEKQNINLV